MTNYIVKLFILFSVVFFTACNNNNDQSSSSGELYKIRDHAYSSGTISHTGFDHLNNSITGTMSVNETGYLHGNKVVTTTYSYNINSGENKLEGTVVSTYDEQGRAIRTINNYSGTECTLINEDANEVPVEIEVGYVTDTFQYSCDDGTSYTMIGKLEYLDEEYANLVYTITYASGSTGKLTTTIKSDGQPVDHKIDVDFASGETIDLELI